MNDLPNKITEVVELQKSKLDATALLLGVGGMQYTHHPLAVNYFSILLIIILALSNSFLLLFIFWRMDIREASERARNRNE